MNAIPIIAVITIVIYTRSVFCVAIIYYPKTINVCFFNNLSFEINVIFVFDELVINSR